MSSFGGLTLKWLSACGVVVVRARATLALAPGGTSFFLAKYCGTALFHCSDAWRGETSSSEVSSCMSLVPMGVFVLTA